MRPIKIRCVCHYTGQWHKIVQNGDNVRIFCSFKKCSLMCWSILQYFQATVCIYWEAAGPNPYLSNCGLCKIVRRWGSGILQVMKYFYQIEYFKRLIQMPSMVTTYQKGKLDGTYILPPVKYPDGEFFSNSILGKYGKFVKSPL